MIWMMEMCLGDYSRFSDNFVYPIFHMAIENSYILLVFLPLFYHREPVHKAMLQMTN